MRSLSVGTQYLHTLFTANPHNSFELAHYNQVQTSLGS